MWRGGTRHNKGYIQIKLTEDNPFFAMTDNNGYIFEHRLVMARYLGRLLGRDDIVHHINGNKQDNHFSNLKLLRRGQHLLSYRAGYEEGYRQGIKSINSANS